MKKHAYLIIAHDNFYILETLLKMLDDDRNDIYIHIDIKTEFDFEYFKNITKYSNIYYVKRENIKWGHYSMIQAELNLFKAALEGGDYRYFHLLSGVDLPLKSQEYIHDYLEKNDGTLLVSCTKEKYMTNPQILRRFQYYWLFKGKLRKYIIKVQKKLKFSRLDPTIKYNFGSQWVSITDEVVRLIISKEKWIQKTFRFGYICDEIYIQTIIMNSEYMKDLCDKPNSEERISGNMRYTRWPVTGGAHPIIFEEKDFEELIQSDCLFARKFSETVDKKIIDMIYTKIMGKE